MAKDEGKLIIDLTDPQFGFKAGGKGQNSQLLFELGDRIRPELQTYPLYCITDTQARLFYEWQKWFAAKRNPPPEEVERILASYASAMDRPYLAPVARRVATLAEARPGEPVNVIELGGANAALLHWWPQNMPSVPLKYVGIEPYPPFVEHARKIFPQAQFIHSDAEGFLNLDFEPFKPVTAFIAATVFCFVHPDVVRQCILKAAELTDDILIRDFIVNAQGQLVPPGQGHLSFDYFQRRAMPTLFAHRFEDYFQEIGFHVVHMEETRTEVDLPGWALIHVQRKVR